MVKSKLVDSKVIPAFAKMLLYVCQPCLTFYSFDKADYSGELLVNLGLFFLIAFISQAGFLLLFYFIFRKRSVENVRFRIVNIAMVLGNCGFFGIPVVERLFPQRSDAAALCLMFTLAMNLLCWTMVLYIVTRDKRYITLRQLLVNPATVSFAVSFVMFIFSLKLPGIFAEAASLGGKISTPLCMTILGMRLASTSFSKVFLKPVQYVAVVAKQMIIPLVVFGAVYFLPVDLFLKQLSFVLFCCPVASNVLNFAEIGGQGQEEASGCVLLGTITSIATMPLMLLLL